MSDQDDTSLPPLQSDDTNQPDDNAQPPAQGNGAPSPIAPSGSLSMAPPQLQTPTINIPEEAADVDLIEKDWVIKAKQIVEQTSENPHAQQQEIAKMKTEYIKKRYKRDIEL